MGHLAFRRKQIRTYSLSQNFSLGKELGHLDIDERMIDKSILNKYDELNQKTF